MTERPGSVEHASDIHVSVIYAPPPPSPAHRLEVTLPRGATVASALAAAKPLVEIYSAAVPEMYIAVYGERVDEETSLNDGDRVELLRPLVKAPTEQRRARHARQSGRPTDRKGSR